MATLFIFFTSLLLCFAIIKISNRYKLFQPEREEIVGINTKKFVPTVGGIAIFLSLNMYCVYFMCEIPIILLGNFYALLGFVDDYLKLKRKKYNGLHMKYRLFFEIISAMIFVLYTIAQDPTRNYIPYLTSGVLVLSVLWGTWVMLSAANSYNLTDGVDSLASTLAIVTMIFLIFHTPSQLPLAIIFALLGYLFFNWPPAKLLMGDTGALGIGVMIGALFYKYHLELLLPIVGIVFVIETVSVIIQIFYIRVLKRRLFLMAPLHHHFESKKWKKKKILLLFNLIAILGLSLAWLI